MKVSIVKAVSHIKRSVADALWAEAVEDACRAVQHAWRNRDAWAGRNRARVSHAGLARGSLFDAALSRPSPRCTAIGGRRACAAAEPLNFVDCSRRPLANSRREWPRRGNFPSEGCVLPSPPENPPSEPWRNERCMLPSASPWEL